MHAWIDVKGAAGGRMHGAAGLTLMYVDVADVAAACTTTGTA